MVHLSNDHIDSPNQHKNSHKLCNEMGHPVLILWKVNGNWDNNMIRISQWRQSHCRTNTNVRINKSKRAGLSESQSGIQVGKTNKLAYHSSQRVFIPPFSNNPPPPPSPFKKIFHPSLPNIILPLFKLCPFWDKTLKFNLILILLRSNKSNFEIFLATKAILRFFLFQILSFHLIFTKIKLKLRLNLYKKPISIFSTSVQFCLVFYFWPDIFAWIVEENTNSVDVTILNLTRLFYLSNHNIPVKCLNV